ncbi:hypothetical protein ACJWU8_28310 [Klebsiella pneumoniae]
MIDVNLDFSGLQDIARDLQTLSKAENIRRQLPRPHRDNYSGLFVI